MPLKPEITYDDFAKLDLRVATIEQAQPHPNADRLLKLQIDLGFEKRQICAGIRQYAGDPQALVGRQIIVVANLAPRKIRGEESKGMLLAATVMGPASVEGQPPAIATPEATPTAPPEPPEVVVDIVLLTTSKPVPPGSTVG